MLGLEGSRESVERERERDRERVAILAQVICPCLLLRGWVVPAGPLSSQRVLSAGLGGGRVGGGGVA